MIVLRSGMKSRINVILRVLLIFIAALAVSCRGKGATQIAEFPARYQALPPTITVVNWNVQKGDHPQIAKDLKLLLEQEKPDIVFLQEARSGLFVPEEMGGYFAEGWRYPWPGGTTTGVLTLSRVPPLGIQPVPTIYRELVVAAPKVSLVTEYPLSNGKNPVCFCAGNLYSSLCSLRLSIALAFSSLDS